MVKGTVKVLMEGKAGVGEQREISIKTDGRCRIELEEFGCEKKGNSNFGQGRMGLSGEGSHWQG